MSDALDLSGIFDLETPEPKVFVGTSPRYYWGRVYGGLLAAQALWGAMQTVDESHAVHSLHAYFILPGSLDEPIRYRVEPLRRGRSFSTCRVVAEQGAGALLTLVCSFQAAEQGPDVSPVPFPADVPPPEELERHGGIGAEIREVPRGDGRPGARTWLRYPLPVGAEVRLHACALAYLSDIGPVPAVLHARPREDEDRFFVASLDHALWFHRPPRADDWLLSDLGVHAVVGTRGLATGDIFHRDGTHLATVAQEALLRPRQPRR